MAFFEDIGKKVSQTSQEAIRKTKILAETTKLNSKISDEKRTIADLYSKIGERYFEMFSDNPNEGLAEYIAAVKDACRKIEDYEKQINDLKGIERCAGCGAELGEGTAFCPNCGTKVPEPPAEEPKAVEVTIRVCKSCGSQLSETAQFCSGCGQKAD